MRLGVLVDSKGLSLGDLLAEARAVAGSGLDRTVAVTRTLATSVSARGVWI